jgi:hypothetical protein
MPLIMRTTSSTAASAIATTLAREGFLARASDRGSFPLVVVHCMADEYTLVIDRIRRCDPCSVQLPLAAEARTQEPPGLRASA